MALAYHAPLSLSCASPMEDYPCPSLSHQPLPGCLSAVSTLQTPRRKERRFRSSANYFAYSSSSKTSRSVAAAAALPDDCTSAVSASTWEACVLESDIPALVIFWTSWCGPCKMVDPVVEELAAEYAGQIKCYKLNADEDFDIATDYGVKSVPTVVFFKKGEKIHSITGTMPKYVYEDAVKKALA